MPLKLQSFVQPAGHAARFEWVDVVRGLGIFLMFYGHFLQRGIDPANTAATEQFRFIYSFHMPMFFIMSGFFFRPAASIGSRLGELALRRLIPVAFFGAMLFPLWLKGELVHTGLWRDLAAMAEAYLAGHPDLDWVTWFLVCLFVSECLAVPLLLWIRSVPGRIVLGFGCLFLGLLFCEQSAQSNAGLLYWIGRTWFLSEAVVALGFYILGQVAFPWLVRLSHRRLLAGVVFVAATTVVLFTYRLNHPSTIAVMMAARVHGDKLDFLATALAGSVALFSLGMLIGSDRLLQWIGRNTLPLLGLNGLFFHYVDPKLHQLMTPGNGELPVALDALLVTTLSLLLCVPAVYVLNRFFPQLIGKVNVQGPLLPALIKRPAPG